MKAVTGFLSEDGTFFDEGQHCELYDAEQALRAAADAANIKPDRLVEIVQQLQAEIDRYVKAIDATYKARKDNKDDEQQTAPVLKLAP